MPLNLAMFVMSAIECVLWALIGGLFWQRKLQHRFPAMGSFLLLHMLATPILFVFLVGQPRHWFNGLGQRYYFFGFWMVYIVSAAILYFVSLEVFRAALSGFLGLVKFGVVIFRWAALASLVSLSTISFSHRGTMLLLDVTYGMMRAVSVIELCLLGFLCVSMKALRLSMRDLAFGMALGLGLTGANDFVGSLAVSVWAPLTAPWQFVYQSVILLSICIWAVYFALPERARTAVTVPVNSTVYRWNEIASALGHTGTQVAIHQNADGFFLSDVERVVDKVLTRTLKGKESES